MELRELSFAKDLTAEELDSWTAVQIGAALNECKLQVSWLLPQTIAARKTLAQTKIDVKRGKKNDVDLEAAFIDAKTHLEILGDVARSTKQHISILQTMLRTMQ